MPLFTPSFAHSRTLPLAKGLLASLHSEDAVATPCGSTSAPGVNSINILLTDTLRHVRQSPPALVEVDSSLTLRHAFFETSNGSKTLPIAPDTWLGLVRTLPAPAFVDIRNMRDEARWLTIHRPEYPLEYKTDLLRRQVTSMTQFLYGDLRHVGQIFYTLIREHYSYFEDFDSKLLSAAFLAPLPLPTAERNRILAEVTHPASTGEAEAFLKNAPVVLSAEAMQAHATRFEREVEDLYCEARDAGVFNHQATLARLHAERERYQLAAKTSESRFDTALSIYVGHVLEVLGELQVVE